MTVSIETGLTLLEEFRQKLSDAGIEAQCFLTGSTAFNGSGNDADIVAYAKEDMRDALHAYLCANFSHCGEGSYGMQEARSVWVRDQVNIIHAHTGEEAGAWANACVLCMDIVREGKQPISKELRVRIHKACRGEYLV